MTSHVLFERVVGGPQHSAREQTALRRDPFEPPQVGPIENAGNAATARDRQSWQGNSRSVIEAMNQIVVAPLQPADPIHEVERAETTFTSPGGQWIKALNNFDTIQYAGLRGRALARARRRPSPYDRF